jgi:zinc transport system permease protein
VFDSLIGWVDTLIATFCARMPEDTLWSFEWNVRGLLAVLFVCLICGAMGALVVGNRMAFFSDALAHCAFAGVGIGVALALFIGTDKEQVHERILEVMVIFGIAIGLLIAFVRERTGLASDTVIGVFYAAAIGLGAVLTRLVRDPTFFRLEQFIFGDPVTVRVGEVLCLGLLGAGILTFLGAMYNHLVMASASSSLALSRRVPVRLCQYLFVIALAIMVNLSIYVVGALLINGMLIVPAAAAANLARNLRQMFWYSIGLACLAGLSGYVLSWEVGVFFQRRGRDIGVGTSGTIVVVAVLIFVASMVVGRLLREWPAAEATVDATAAESNA